MTPRRGLTPRPTAPAALAAGAVAGLIAVASPVPHAAATPTSCTADQVTVIVVGQGTGCARAGLTGTDSLRDAGFSVTKVQTQPGFICRINGAPADDPCVRTPPASAYWAYYHAPLGGEWTYSQLGADNRRAPAGTVEAWAFGDGARPGAVPDPPAAPRTTARPTPRAEPTSTRTRPSTRSDAAPPAPAAPGAGAPVAGPPVGPAGEGAGIVEAPAVGAQPEERADPPADAAPAELPPLGPGTPGEEGAPAGEGDPAAEEGTDPGAGEPADGVPVDGEPGVPDDAGSVSDEAADVLASDTGPGRTSPWAYVAVGGLVAVLAAAGFVAARRFRQ